MFSVMQGNLTIPVMVMVRVQYYGVKDGFCIQRAIPSFFLATRDPAGIATFWRSNDPSDTATLPTLVRTIKCRTVFSFGADWGMGLTHRRRTPSPHAEASKWPSGENERPLCRRPPPRPPPARPLSTHSTARVHSLTRSDSLLPSSLYVHHDSSHSDHF